ncbi:MAG: hypothetical protein ER33_13820 [Cyanobium sp. CACIAM 14]|nr:MAG: hypothetical protein ER33_13820 [Cyanobium sp. CACIAM 14]
MEAPAAAQAGGRGGGKPPGDGGRTPPALAGGSSSWPPRTLLSALVLLAMGFGAGWGASTLRTSPAQATGGKAGLETRGDLLAQGWSEADQGVFIRRCQGNCRMPRLYGGGVVDVMEVSCLERPCGQIQAVFDVLDGQGQVVQPLTLQHSGRQGERLQLVLESERPEARRFVLREFRAKARVD